MAKVFLQQKILVVEDSLDSRNVLISALRALKFANIHFADTGKKALLMLGKESFDIVFLDIDIPEPNGLEMLKTIKEKWPDLFVVMVTGNTDADVVRQAIGGGAAGYIAKPFTIGRIADTLKKFKPKKSTKSSSA